MKWLFRGFFCLLAACVLIALIGWGKNLFAAERSCKAVVRDRSKQVCPMMVGFGRKDRVDYQLTFFIPEENRTLTFGVSEELYEQCPVGTGGTLTYRGTRLLAFRLL